MASRRVITVDGNEATTSVAHRLSEVIVIYPITPSSPMGEGADERSVQGQTNIWGFVPEVMEMQSEAGAIGSVHGVLQSGALSTTFTASQGLLLMIPNMFKIAGELTSTVFHVSARSVATHALSIFGDHSDVMACRSTGWGMLAAGSPQEVMDNAVIAQAASLASRVPFLQFFDGFRTSHEELKIEELTDDDLRAMIDDELVRQHRARALNPDRPFIRGTAQNPDVFFQAREACNPFYEACAGHVQEAMDKFASVVGRQYHLFDYIGDPDAERVIVLMGSGAEAAHEAVEYLGGKGEKIGILKVRLYRPFAGEKFIEALPKTVKTIATLDRTKEPGALGEPLYLDVITALEEHFSAGHNGLSQRPRVIGGRYGLSSKEFTPAMVKGVFDEMGKAKPKNHFTVGINDDVTGTSITYDAGFSTEADDVVRGLFYGLGSDGTVGANKNSIKIIGEGTDFYAQGYYVYDSKKAGSVTVSHLRFGPRPIRSSYLIDRANFIACHQQVFLDRYDMLQNAIPGATFLLNSTAEKDEVWDTLPVEVQKDIIEKKLKFYAINGYRVAKETGMGARINTIMQTCFFAISGVLPRDEAIAQIKGAIEKTYGIKGAEIVEKNFAAVDQTVANLCEIEVPSKPTATRSRPPAVSAEAPEFVRNVTAEIIANRGDQLPVSAMPVDGTFPSDTARWEKRNIALEIPVWDEATCIQCGKCAFVCPHAAIRMKAFPEAHLKDSPKTFKAVQARGPEFKADPMMMCIQVAPEDCTGCGMCIEVCPAKNKAQPNLKAINMEPQAPLREPERENYAFFLGLPEFDRSKLKVSSVKGSQYLQPLFEYSGACAACGETPYVKLLTQLFGDRAIIANATGCSSIYGGNLPTAPWSKTAEGRGPAWSNSLFEDNAEFGMGFRLTLDKHREFAGELLTKLADKVGPELVDAILNADQSSEAGIGAQRERVAQLEAKLQKMNAPEAANLQSVMHALVNKSVWVVGGDGWAYDIGYGGLDHVLASGANVNVLVLDTEVYSNTGGQCSKATPLGAIAKFAAAGKPLAKKDLGMMAMAYGSVYVAQIAMGANDAQTVKAFVEAEAYDGPSIIIAYSHCIAHGINMRTGLTNQKAAVQCGYWPLYRFNPALIAEGKNPLKLESKAPTIPFEKYAYSEARYKMLVKSDPERAKKLLAQAQEVVLSRFHQYEELAKVWAPPEDAAS
ncbi:MAG: pyruvate:ferredoxin (flavodoxin) oxidoreductase [bacterium]|nr:pyruvate:ferredoxin (flavodoxin) oxidoreductase [bacterium]